MRLFAEPDIAVERRDDGCVLLRSRTPLEPYERNVAAVLRKQAAENSDRPFLCERPGGGEAGPWRTLTFGEAADAATRIGQALIERGLGLERPVMALSGNSIEFALLMLGCFTAGVPFVPVSVAYSLMSRDHAQVRHIASLIEPGLVYAAPEEPFRPALVAIGHSATPLSELLSTPPGPEVEAAFAGVGPDDVAKVMFTSGSTGLPKGVINTHRMLCANMQMLVQIWPFLREEPPVLVDWTPWNHTFGGNNDFSTVLFFGGTMYVDDGKPVPGLIERTVANLREVSPTVYLNVPRGFAALMPYLENDDDLAATFFARLRLIFYAGAALPRDLWDRLDRLARRVTGGPVPMTSAWGSTETAPMATSAHFPLDAPGNIGVPVPGTEVKLVPTESTFELRVRGEAVFPGYWREPDKTAAAFDEEGFYRIGDAARLVDADDPGAGLLFDGRVAEDFKLTTATWVSVTRVRTGVVSAAAPLLQDVVVCAPDRDEVCVMAWLDRGAVERGFGLTGDMAAVVADPDVRKHVQTAIAAYNSDHPGSSSRIARVLLLTDPPAIDANEVTDKGYINQRAVLANRAADVDRLYADPPDPSVLVL
jgi:feruloyl-CoA synthase